MWGCPKFPPPSRDHLFNSKVGTGKLTAPYQASNEGVDILKTPSRNQQITGEEVSKTENSFEGALPNSTPSEPSEVSLIPLSVIVDFLVGPAVVETTGGGGTSNDLGWNDERRRREEARENHYIQKPFKRRR